MKKAILAVVMWLGSTGAVADHWVELEANYTSGDYSSSYDGSVLDVELSIPSLSAQVYIPSVSIDGGAYQEAGFLEQASMVYFSNQVTSVDSEFKNAEYNYHNEAKGRYRQTTVGGYGVINGWLIGGEVEAIVSQGDRFADIYKVATGYYLADAALLSVGLGTIQIDCDNCDETDSLLEVAYRQVFLANEPMSYALAIDWMKTDESHKYGVEGTMYFTPKAGLTLRVEKNTASWYSDTDLSIKYQQFINERVGLSASYTDSENYGADDESVGLVSFGMQVNI